MKIVRCNFADLAELRRVHELQRAAYAIEAELIGCGDMPGLRESEAELARSGEEFWGSFVPGAAGVGDAEVGARGETTRQCVGIVAIEPEPGAAGVLRIARLAVDPGCFGRGIGRRLVRHVLALAGDGTPAAEAVIVSTGAANLPARRLYESLGFALTREFATPDGKVGLVEYRVRV